MTNEQTYWGLIAERDAVTHALEVMESDPFYGHLANDWRANLMARHIVRASELDREIKAARRNRPHKKYQNEGLTFPTAEYPLPNGASVLGSNGLPIRSEKWAYKQLSESLSDNSHSYSAVHAARIDECLILIHSHTGRVKRDVLVDAGNTARSKSRKRHNKDFSMARGLEGTAAMRYR